MSRQDCHHTKQRATHLSATPALHFFNAISNKYEVIQYGLDVSRIFYYMHVSWCLTDGWRTRMTSCPRSSRMQYLRRCENGSPPPSHDSWRRPDTGRKRSPSSGLSLRPFEPGYLWTEYTAR